MTRAVLLSWRNGSDAGDHTPCIATGISIAMCSRNTTELHAATRRLSQSRQPRTSSALTEDSLQVELGTWLYVADESKKEEKISDLTQGTDHFSRDLGLQPHGSMHGTTRIK